MLQGLALEEPRLTVRPRRSILRRRPGFSATVAALLAFLVAATTVLAVNGRLLLPFDKVVTLEGGMGSKAEYFEDAEVQRLLLRHGIRVHITPLGSQEIARGGLSRFDFVLPSGLPSANAITDRRKQAGTYVKAFHPFVSPLVLATYRVYAQTLEDHGIAVPRIVDGQRERPLYYTLHLRDFLLKSADGTKWEDLGIQRHGTTNKNRILASTSNICQSNSAETYLAEVAYTMGDPPDTVPDETTVAAVTAKIRPLLTAQGLPRPDVFAPYVSVDGPLLAPVVVAYEHQYLAHQVRYYTEHHRIDTDRVLLYPEARFVTEPQLLALNQDGDRLGELVTQDPGLRRRAVALGFHTLGDQTDSGELTDYLHARGIPVFESPAGDTRALMPNQTVLDEMVDAVGGCRTPGRPTAGATP
ncbi:hypothetical protein ACFCX4_08315 [Kitasatospora sp. NPDC056327]|uniref:hypothetical protein n=1 Tax=Kitasatospora sp. NPDC056327 TaxID=3345785 RepID=UPI0035DDC098